MEAELKEIIEWAIGDMQAYLQTFGHPQMTEAQCEEFARRIVPVTARLARVHPSLNDDETGLLVLTAALDVVHELVFGDHPFTEEGQVSLAFELGEIGALEVVRLVRAGGYTRPTPAQDREMVTALRRRVERMMKRCTPPATARDQIREFAGYVVALVLGEAPASPLYVN